jgi:hypothetical protein
LAIRKLLVCAAALAIAIATTTKIAITAAPLHEQVIPNNGEHEAPHCHPGPPSLLILRPSSSKLRLIVHSSSSLTPHWYLGTIRQELDAKSPQLLFVVLQVCVRVCEFATKWKIFIKHPSPQHSPLLPLPKDPPFLLTPLFLPHIASVSIISVSPPLWWCCVVLVLNWSGARMPPSSPSPQERLVEMRAAMRATARPTAAPSEDDGKLDGNNGSVDVVAI